MNESPIVVTVSAPDVVVVDYFAGPPGVSSGGAGGYIREKLIVTSNNQTVFTLGQIPAAPHLMQVFVNGAKAEIGIDFVVNVLVLTWISSIRLDPEDSLEVYY